MLETPTPRPARTLAALLAGALLTLLLAACSSDALAPAPGGSAPTTSDAAGVAAESQIGAALDALFAEQLATDATVLTEARLAASDAAPTSQAVEPTVVVHRSELEHDVDTVEVTVDADATPPTAEATVDVTITGVAELWRIWPDTAAPITLLGEKPIAMTGTWSFDLVWRNDDWRVTAVDPATYTQGERAAAVDAVEFDPDPLLAGSERNVVVVDLAPAEGDDYLVVARGRHLRPKSVLMDDGHEPDETAGDTRFSGYLAIGEDVRVGHHLGAVTALNVTATTDLTTDDGGAFAVPYTDTLHFVVVDVAAP